MGNVAGLRVTEYTLLYKLKLIRVEQGKQDLLWVSNHTLTLFQTQFVLKVGFPKRLWEGNEHYDESILNLKDMLIKKIPTQTIAFVGEEQTEHSLRALMWFVGAQSKSLPKAPPTPTYKSHSFVRSSFGFRAYTYLLPMSK